MHCQRETCRRIIWGKGNYLFSLKENQPSLLKNIRVFFEDVNEKLDSFQTLEKNAGCIEKRICRKVKDISWLKEHKWPGLQSVFSIERITQTHGKPSRETSFYISSCDTSPEYLMALAREHWKIESMHWLLDVTFSEDDCRFLSENARRTMPCENLHWLSIRTSSPSTIKILLLWPICFLFLDQNILLALLCFF